LALLGENWKKKASTKGQGLRVPYDENDINISGYTLAIKLPLSCF
jgi:hypothetical protein